MLVEAAVDEALERGSRRLETIQQILRLPASLRSTTPSSHAVPTAEALLAITIDEPELADTTTLRRREHGDTEDRGAAASSRRT